MILVPKDSRYIDCEMLINDYLLLNTKYAMVATLIGCRLVAAEIRLDTLKISLIHFHLSIILFNNWRKGVNFRSKIWWNVVQWSTNSWTKILKILFVCLYVEVSFLIWNLVGESLAYLKVRLPSLAQVISKAKYQSFKSTLYFLNC